MEKDLEIIKRYPAIDLNRLEMGEFRFFKDRTEIWFRKDGGWGEPELRHTSYAKSS